MTTTTTCTVTASYSIGGEIESRDTVLGDRGEAFGAAKLLAESGQVCGDEALVQVSGFGERDGLFRVYVNEHSGRTTTCRVRSAPVPPAAN